MRAVSEGYVPSPMLRQPAFRLPGGKRVAVWIGLHVEYWSLLPPPGSFVVKGIHGNWPDHFPDYRTHSFREYGNRVGIFRIFDVTARLGLPVSIIINADSIRRYPAIIEEASRLGADFILQGRLANRMITSAMSEADERAEIEQSIAAYRDAFGRAPVGWMGPEAGESSRTLQLLAAAGIEFVLDWPNDDTPHAYATQPPILSIPYQWELDDLDLLWSRNISVQKYPRIIFSAYNGLANTCSASVRVFGLHVHPWILGQPARIRHLDAALARIHESADAQFMTVSEIATLSRDQLAQSGAPPPAPLPSSKEESMAQTSSYIPADRASSSKSLWERARHVSPMGAQGEGKYYSPYPHFITRAAGSSIWDVDGFEYIDYWNGAGPCVLGHGDPSVNQAVTDSIAEHGVLFCAPHEGEVELCETLAALVPCAEMSALLNAGTDVLCMALRVARAATGRRLIVKFAGSYHGWYDSLLFNITSYNGPADNEGRYRPIAESSGIPEDATDAIRVLEYNNIAAVERLFEQEGQEIAAIVVEPVMHGPLAGSIPPKLGFLERIRELCTKHGAVLVFDEILTGFRHDIGGAQKLCGVTPDLAAFGKAISNGFPLAALCGKRAVMRQLSPDGHAYFSGTYNGNVTSVAAALATIAQLKDGTVHRRLWDLGARLRDGFNTVFEDRQVEAKAVSYGSLVAIHFSRQPLQSFGDVVRLHDPTRSREFVSFLYENGVYTKPRKVLRFAISAAHQPADIDRTIELTDTYFEKH